MTNRIMRGGDGFPAKPKAEWDAMPATTGVGEVAMDLEDCRIRVGDGVHAWAQIPYSWTPTVDPSTVYDAAGAAAAAQAGSLQKSANLSDVSNATTARSNLGLGTAAVQPATAFSAAPATPVASSATSGTLTAGAEHALAPTAAAAWSLPTGVTSTTLPPTTVKNNGTATLTVARGGADTINGGAGSISLAPGEWARFTNNGAGAWTQSGTAGQSGTYARIPTPAGIAFVGDSIINNAGVFDGSSNPSPRYECRAWMEWARAINGAFWERVGPSTSYGWAHGGYTTDDVISNGYHTSAAASSATAVCVLVGTNDLASQTAAYIFGRLQTIWAPSLAAGKTVIACLLLPRSDQIAKVDAVNLLIRQACATTKNLVLCDMYGAMVDPATGAPRSGVSDDGVHPNLTGAAVMGAVFAGVVSALFPHGSPPDVRIESSADQITRNPYGTGNVSGLPTNWSKFNLGSGSTVATKVTRTDAAGEWTNLVVTAATPNTDGVQLQVAQPSQKWAVGDTLRAVAELNITAGYDLRGLMLYAYGNAATAQAYWGYRSASDGAALTTGAPVSGKLWLVTPVWTVPASATGSMTANLQVYGPGTIQVGRFGVVRV